MGTVPFSERYAHVRVRDTIAELTKRKVKIPREVTTRLAALEKLLGQQPRRPEDEVIIAAFIADKPEEAAALAAEATDRKILHNAWTLARDEVARKVRRALTGNAEAIVKELAKQAAPHIDTLNQTAALGPVDELLRNGKVDEATTVAKAGVAAAELRALYDLRNLVCLGADWTGGSGTDFEWWKQAPKIVEALRTNSVVHGKPHPAEGLDLFLFGIRAGAELWFPTPNEAHAVGAAYAASLRKVPADA